LTPTVGGAGFPSAEAFAEIQIINWRPAQGRPRMPAKKYLPAWINPNITGDTKFAGSVRA